MLRRCFGGGNTPVIVITVVEELASYVRRKSPDAHCFTCIAAYLQTDERSLHEASQVLALLQGFRVSRRTYSACGQSRDVMELNPDYG